MTPARAEWRAVCVRGVSSNHTLRLHTLTATTSKSRIHPAQFKSSFAFLSSSHSQVTCLACDHRSNTVEPFWDLSLEFPERYHSNSRESAAQASCHLTEMLAKFTETEALEGNIYACDHCNCKCNATQIQGG